MERDKNQNDKVKNFTKRLIKIYFVFLSVAVSFQIIAVFILIQLKSSYGISLVPSSADKIKQFVSEDEFKDYYERSRELSEASLGFSMGMGRSQATDMPELTVPGNAEMGTSQLKAAPDRISDTNVQVKGIDEPDIVKTDGKQIYYSLKDLYYIMPQPIPMRVNEGISSSEKSMIMPPQTSSSETKILNAFPPSELAKLGGINKVGDLLLYKNILMVFADDGVFGYDVSDPSNPVEKWNMKLGQNRLVQARLYNNNIYLVTATTINSSHPCPITPIMLKDVPVSIDCSRIYHPVTDVPIDVTYTALIVNADIGEIKNKLSFVGSSNTSLVYMSSNALYITYSYFGDYVKFMYGFLFEKAQDVISSSVLQRLSDLQSYDISSRAKMVELETILEEYYSSLSSDERLRVENEIRNRMESYYKEHKRELEKTGIVKIALSGFEIVASGEVSGSPLNQFSLDEYEGNLRIATTVQGFRFGSQESTSDVYILNNKLRQLGVIRDLGLKERIYSVRFIEDKGYVVTFRQIDPFYVLDLSNPLDPQMKGELKIPGYSSYLDPITGDKILGVGMEGSNVKLSLFDVSNPSNPREISKYNLDEYSSDILNTHHAFLLDSKHEVFFIPGTKGGYIFSYKNDELRLIRAISNVQAKRAIYLGDYIYIIGSNEIVALDENDWKEAERLEL